jgi:hypothetical protein
MQFESHQLREITANPASLLLSHLAQQEEKHLSISKKRKKSGVNQKDKNQDIDPPKIPPAKCDRPSQTNAYDSKRQSKIA